MAEPNSPKPSPWKALLGSRKFVVAVLTVVVSLIVMIAARFGLEWDATKMIASATPVVLSGLTLIFGIAYEDGQAKSAGAGTVATTTPTATGAIETKIEPTGKP